MQPDDRSRPGLPAGAARKTTYTKINIPLIDSPGAAGDALVVIVGTPMGRKRRRVFLSLHGATAAVDRARAAGQPVSVVLCRLTPVKNEVPELVGLDPEGAL